MTVSFGCGSTVTVKVAMPLFPLVSVDVHVTVLTPTGKVKPDAGVQLTGRAPSTRSKAVAVNAATAPAGPVAPSVSGAGTVTTGGTVSRASNITVTSNAPVALLPCKSVHEQCTVVGPIGNTEPEARSQTDGTVPSTMSVADPIVNGTVAGPGAVSEIG